MSPTVEKCRRPAGWMALVSWVLCTLVVPGVRAESIPRPEGIQQDVNFWVRVYTEVTTNEGFLHDERNLSVVY